MCIQIETFKEPYNIVLISPSNFKHISNITLQSNDLLVIFEVSSVSTKVHISDYIAIVHAILAMNDKFSDLLPLVEPEQTSSTLMGSRPSEA